MLSVGFEYRAMTFKKLKPRRPMDAVVSKFMFRFVRWTNSVCERTGNSIFLHNE